MEEKRRVRDIGDSLIMLWGQLTANGVVDEHRQRIQRLNFIPIQNNQAFHLLAEDENISDLFD
jgi:hypothetical protein